jgi:hypothetical protein
MIWYLLNKPHCVKLEKSKKQVKVEKNKQEMCGMSSRDAKADNSQHWQAPWTEEYTNMN